MILSRIQTEPGIARGELARLCGFSEMAATRIVRELLAAGIIKEATTPSKLKQEKKHVGRPKTGLHIVKDGLFAAGITVSAYHSEVSICGADGQLCASSSPQNVPFDSVQDAARFYAYALRDLIEASGIDESRIVGIGVALSARTAPGRGEIVRSEYFGWANDGGQFCREIQKVIDLPVEIDNISNALAIAEMRFGVARDVADFTLVHVATFVGAGMVSDNRLVRGDTGISGLLGHFRAEEQPLTCTCGRNDCLNLCVTGFGLLSQMGKLDHRAFDTSKLSFYAATLLATLDDPDTDDLIAEAGSKLAPALDSVGKLLNPRMIILAGYLGTNDAYFDAIQATLKDRFDHDSDRSFALVKGAIGSVRAATLLALHAFCYSDRLDYDRFASVAQQAGGATHG